MTASQRNWLTNIAFAVFATGLGILGGATNSPVSNELFLFLLPGWGLAVAVSAGDVPSRAVGMVGIAVNVLAWTLWFNLGTRVSQWLRGRRRKQRG
jgi:hypothetical protein